MRTVLFVFLVSCNNYQYKGKEIIIVYSGDVKEGEWIKVDNFRLYHKDIQNFLTNPDFLVLDSIEVINQLEEFESDIYLPTTKSTFYHQGFKGYKTVKHSNNYMSYQLFKGIVRKWKMIHGNNIDSFPYLINNNAELMHKGTLRISRKNGAQIVVETSKNYPISIQTKN